MNASFPTPSREQLLHSLFEAAELEHNLMCTYLYAVFSLRDGESEGLSAREAEAVRSWRRAIMAVAKEEMGHLTAIWNITSALGGSPRFGRGNFPLDPGHLPAGVVVKLASFNEAVLQHFIHLERPANSREPDGENFAPEFIYARGTQKRRLTPMATDYETVGVFYESLGANLNSFVARLGEANAFCGDPALQLSPAESILNGVNPVICSKTALAAFKAIVEQGEGAPEDAVGSHYQRFIAIRSEYAALKAANPNFHPALPAAVNPVLRTPLRSAGRVWLENEEAAMTVDLANTGYALMLRLIAYSYAVPRPQPEKVLAVDLALGLMRAVTKFAEHAARLPAGPSNPDCNAGMSFSALRDAAPLPQGTAARRFFIERINELADVAAAMADGGSTRLADASRLLSDLAKQTKRGFEDVASTPQPSATPNTPIPPAAKEQSSGDIPAPTAVDGLDNIEGEKLTLLYDGKKCIHSRFCVTGAPQVFLANVKGPWIKPDAINVDRLVEIAHACPSGAIRYRRKDGKPDETPPPVNLIGVREGGPYAVHADIRLSGQSGKYRLTLCRCGASKNKPYCDSSHHEVNFSASGEPPTGEADMLPVRDGPLAIEPQTDGPLAVRGNMEIISGTGRVVARVENAKLCRCGGSQKKPFCDGTHARNGFRSS